MRPEHVFGQLPLVAPQDNARLYVNRHHLVSWSGDEHGAVIHDRDCLVSVVDSRRHDPDWLEAIYVRGRYLGERTVAPAIEGAAAHQPVSILRMKQPFRGYGRVVLKAHRDWARRRGFRAFRRVLRELCNSAENYYDDPVFQNHGVLSILFEIDP